MSALQTASTLLAQVTTPDSADRRRVCVCRTGAVVRITELTAEPLLERRQIQGILVRFVLLYLVLQVWGIVGSLFVVGLGSGLFDIAAIIPQIVRALIFVSIGWPLRLDTTRVLDIALPDFMYKPAIGRVLVAVAALAAISGQLFRGPLFL